MRCDVDVCDSIEFKNDIDQFLEQSDNFLHFLFIFEIDIDEVFATQEIDVVIEIFDIVRLLFDFDEFLSQ